MIDWSKIRQGLEVFGSDNKSYGTIERITDNEVYINGRAMPRSAFERFENNRLYMGNASMSQSTGYAQNQNEIRVPVVEERLNVEKRQAEMGEVQVHKRVVSEQQSIPVELRHEEVEVQERDIADRPLRPGEMEGVFQEGTIRVPLRGEEAVASKQAFVTGEVAIEKEVVTERQQIADTVRREEVIVDKNVDTTRRNVRTDVDVDRTATAATTGYTDTNTTGYVDRNTTTDYTATDRDSAAYASTSSSTSSSYNNAQISEGMEVYAADGKHLGKIKEAGGSSFVVGRGFFKDDLEVDYSSVQNIQGDQLVLNLTNDQINDLI